MSNSMKSDGHYNKYSSVQFAAASHSLNSEFISLVDFPSLSSTSSPSTSLSITDYGCSQGKNSLPLLSTILSFAMNKMPNLQNVFLIQNDLFSNDWNELSRTMKEFTDNWDRKTSNNENIQMPKINFILSFSPLSFYRQLQSDSSSDFGFAATSLHWLSDYPMEKFSDSEFPSVSIHNFNGNLNITKTMGNESPTDDLSIFDLHSARDWKTFLTLRNKEMRLNGYLYFLNVSLHPLHHSSHLDYLFILFKFVAKTHFSEYKIFISHFIIPLYFRRYEDQQRGRNGIYEECGWDIKRIQFVEVENPIIMKYHNGNEEKDKGSEREFLLRQSVSDEYIETVRSWSESSFIRAMKMDPKYQQEEKNFPSFLSTICEQFFSISKRVMCEDEWFNKISSVKHRYYAYTLVQKTRNLVGE